MAEENCSKSRSTSQRVRTSFPSNCLHCKALIHHPDYDPEADGLANDSDSDASDDEDQRAGTEHYESVGKSKLRQKDSVSLGPQYRGSKVSRAALEEESEAEEDDEDEDDASEGSEDYADPDLVDLEADEAEASDSEIDSDDALAESDADRLKDFVFRGSSKPKANGKARSNSRATAADFMSGSEEEEEQDYEDALEGLDSEASDEDDMDDGLDALVNGGLDSEEDDDESDANDDEDDEDDDEDDSQSEDDEASGGKAAPKLAGPTVSSARLDVEKGIAIQKQRKTYDELLNLRIRLQKALVAVNTFPTLEDEAEHTSEPYEAAEEAAVNLLNTISNLKERFGPVSKAGSKRKRELDSSMSNQAIWEHLQADEPGFLRFRRDRLEKWSKKVQSATVTTTSGLSSRNKTLVDALDEQLDDPTSRLVKRTRVARSCAPAQAAKRVTEDEQIYDDADFYQQLLKELVEQRTIDTAGDQISAVPSVMLTAAGSAKTRKNVDRKASKGRKMRFTVHEKLQNFMAPEDRRTWEQGAADRLFGTLFGQKMELDENHSEEEDMEELQAQADGLRLFR